MKVLYLEWQNFKNMNCFRITLLTVNYSPHYTEKQMKGKAKKQKKTPNKKAKQDGIL